MARKYPKHSYTQTDGELLYKLNNIVGNEGATKQEISSLLGIANLNALNIKIYGNNSDLYREIIINKRNGEPRILREPNAYLKKYQRNLNHLMKLLYNGKICSHGFEKNKNIVTNAAVHVNKKYILKIDLKDFFPSIGFPRVMGVFLNHPFNFNKEISVLLAHFCIYQSSLLRQDNGELPQGAPTSPIISNLVCRRLDNQLFELAKKYKCTYSRYADDLTFSTNLTEFPKELCDNYVIGEQLENIITQNGFVLTPYNWSRNRVSILIKYKQSRKD